MPEIMHPLVAKGEEMNYLRALTDRIAREVMAKGSRSTTADVGTMIELPRPALTAARAPGQGRRVLLPLEPMT